MALMGPWRSPHKPMDNILIFHSLFASSSGPTVEKSNLTDLSHNPAIGVDHFVGIRCGGHRVPRSGSDVGACFFPFSASEHRSPSFVWRYDVMMMKVALYLHIVGVRRRRRHRQLSHK
jgi:hypothetical protein